MAWHEPNGQRTSAQNRFKHSFVKIYTGVSLFYSSPLFRFSKIRNITVICWNKNNRLPPSPEIPKRSETLGRTAHNEHYLARITSTVCTHLRVSKNYRNVLFRRSVRAQYKFSNEPCKIRRM